MGESAPDEFRPIVREYGGAHVLAWSARQHQAIVGIVLIVEGGLGVSVINGAPGEEPSRIAIIASEWGDDVVPVGVCRVQNP